MKTFKQPAGGVVPCCACPEQGGQAGDSEEHKALPSQGQRSSALGAQPEHSGSQHSVFTLLPKAGCKLQRLRPEFQ